MTALRCWWVLRRMAGAARRPVRPAAVASTAAPPPRPRILPRPRIRHALVLVCAGGVPASALLLPPEAPPATPAQATAPMPAEAAWRLARAGAAAHAHAAVPVPGPGAALLLATGIAALLAVRRI